MSYYSGGLLYGREVPRPAWFMEGAVRKLSYRPRVCAAARRDRMVELLLQGWSYQRIAKELGTTYPNVYYRVKEACRRERVADRHALARKMGMTIPLPQDRVEQGRARLERVRALLRLGMKYRPIATEMGVSYFLVQSAARRLFRQYGVSSGEELIRRIRAEAKEVETLKITQAA